jgi:hypothetical protein
MDFLNVASDVAVEVEKDSVGGFQPFESDLYALEIKAAYLDKSAKGANNIVTLLETEDGRKFTMTEYITKATGENFYIDKKDGKTKRPMVGFSKMNGLSQLITGKELGAQTLEDKVHKIWDKSQSKEVPQTRKTFTEWTGKKIHVGMLLVLENKSELQGDTYVKTAETREVNEANKLFNENKQTLAEVQAGTEAAFYQEWLKANEGKVRDKTDKSIKAGAPPTAGGVQAGAPISFDE